MDRVQLSAAIGPEGARATSRTAAGSGTELTSDNDKPAVYQNMPAELSYASWSPVSIATLHAAKAAPAPTRKNRSDSRGVVAAPLKQVPISPSTRPANTMAPSTPRSAISRIH